MAPKSNEPVKAPGAAVWIGLAPKKYLTTSWSTMARPKVTRICSACGTLVEVLDQAAFHGNADDQHDRYRQKDRHGNRPVDQPGAKFLAEPGLDIRHLHDERIAEEVLLGRVDHLEGQSEHPLQRHRAEGANHEQRRHGRN